MSDSPVRADTQTTWAKFHLTEKGNSERFVTVFGSNFHWVDPWGKWQAWDGKRWVVDARCAVQGAAKTMPQLIDRAVSEVVDENESDRRQEIRRWANKSERMSVVCGSLEFAKSALAVTPDQFDRDNWLLNVNNGTIDLRTGELKPHDRTDLITRLAPVDYDKDALCPRWEQFLCEIFKNDFPLIEYIGQLAGYWLTGDITEHVFPVLWGQGRNGKSVFVDTLLGILGDYACPAPAGLLTVQRNQEHPTEIAGLQGKRLVVGSETEQGARLRVQLMKSMTGESMLRARLMRGDYFDFPRTFKLVLMTNHKPRVPDNSVAAWERMKLIPFTVQFLEGTPTPPDKHLLETLKSEWPGILAFTVRNNLARLKDEGKPAPDVVKAATAEYRKNEDALAGFLGDAVVLSPEAWTPVAQLKEAFESDGEGRWGRSVTDRLKELGCCTQSRRYGDKVLRGWKGIGLQ